MLIKNKKIETAYSLSPLQEGLLFQTLYAPESDAYFVQSVFELEGEINISALNLAWQKVSDQHPILRTGFIWQDGEKAFQYVLESVEVPFIEYDWQGVEGKQEQEAKLQAFIQEDRKTGFDLNKAPLFRLTLIHCATDKYYLIWSQHHILSDGWSTPIILGDVFKAYEALSQGKDIHFTPTRPYRDYIAWLQKQNLDEAEAFWKETLASLEAPTKLSFKSIIKENKEKDYETFSIAFSHEETEDIKRFAQDHELTLNTVLQGAVGMVLKAYTQQQEVVMGVTLSGRSIDLPGVEEMVGLFINTLPLKISSHPTEDTLTFLKTLQQQTQRLNEYAYTPLAQIQSWTGINQSLFDVIFVFENYPFDEESLNTIHDFSIRGVQGIEKTEYRLTVTIEPGQQLHLSLSYQTEHFDEDLIKKLSDHIKQVLGGMIHNSKESPQTLPLLTQQEQHQLLVEWNDTSTSYPEDKTIHQLFEEQVTKSPHNTAVTFEDQELTYKQLNERANQLAHHLRSLGVGPDTLVAIAVERSLEMIIGLLGILKAGGAYVPLDPSYPQERLQFMLQDTSAPVLITQAHLRERFKDYTGRILSLQVAPETKDLFIEESSSNTNTPKSEKWISSSSHSSENPSPLTAPHNLAYVIYTSGSTGKPKGVMVGHRNFIHYLSYADEAYLLSDEPTLFHSSPAFDMSITTLFLPLIKGNSINILSGEARVDVLAATLKTQKSFSFLKLTPTHLKALRSQLSPKLIQKQRGTLIVGGENLFKNDIEFWFESVPDTLLFNEYGPTEATVGCCILRVEDYGILPSGSIPIGRPISNTQIYILDPQMNPVPVGVSGEIYIGGVGLARGYLNRPDLTAERFIPNPFVNDNSEGEACKLKKVASLDDFTSGIVNTASSLRLYRTGDLARYLPDGNIEFLGRMDDQVKIRGFRIELGEIESTLHSHGDVSQVVVMARDDDPDNKKLVAYIVPGEFTPSHTELREFLLEKLPDYMIPSFFVYVDRLPLTPNGKIDRKTLPAPDLTMRQVGDEYVAPQSQIEQELCAIWAEVLKVEKIGVHDNFFKLGGHSLLATQVISRIRHTYDIDIPLRALFEQPTIAALGIIVDSLAKEKKLSLIPPLIPMTRERTIPLSFAQQRLWFLDQLLPEIALYNIPLALKLKGNLNTLALQKALNTLIARHESLRTTFPSIEGEAHQVILDNLMIDLTMCSQDLIHLKKKDQPSPVETLALEETSTPFNLSTGPLIRVKLLILSKTDHVLLITLHHIISDGWSMDIFFKELSSLYNAYAEDKEPSLPSLPLQYADFALWQRNWLQGEVLEQQLSYWKQQLSNIPDRLDLPFDKPRPQELSYKGASYHFSFAHEIKDKFNELAQDHQTSLFMTLLAAFQLLLYRYTGQKDIVIGSPIANRHYKEIEGLIGFFVNTLALRSTFEDNDTFIDVLTRVKETTLQAYQHQDVPFEQLVDHLNVTRELNRNPVFQVMFTFETGVQEGGLTLKNLSVNPLSSSYPVAKFDLSLNVYETKEELGVGIEYATDLFEKQTIERLANHFKELIKGILSNPHQDIQTLPLLTQQEQHQILVEWNDTSTSYPDDKTIHQLFEEQVTKSPNNTAVIFEDQELTYKELNERANQLAHHLRSLGVGPDILVAIAVERSLEMIIGLLSILKAGGAYVPLDPSYPQDRLQFMLQDTRAPVLITQTHLRENFKDYLGKILSLQVDAETKDCFIENSSYLNRSSDNNRTPETYLNLSIQSSSVNLPLITAPYNLSYIIYTSGSTGKPKGVAIENKGLVNYVESILDKLGRSLFLKFAHVSTFAADLGNTSLYPSLLSGGTLYILGDEYLQNSHLFSSYINQYKIDSFKIVPTHFDTLSMQSETSILPQHNLILGGDIFGEGLLTKIIEERSPKLQIFNHYGPTESTIGCCVFKLENDLTAKSESVPIGRPISNTQIYILDKQMNPVPVGVSGEIYIGGAGLARGYLNRPDLTAEKFIPNPFGAIEEAKEEEKSLRLYQTGDLARYLSDGNIEFLGRIDDQMKIRGFRIELGEIESTLYSHGDITQAVVMAREDDSGNKRLVAYVVPGEFTPSSTELREFLSEKLPDYMIPSFFVYLDKVPLTPNDKIDRKALPAPDLSLRLGGDEYVTPQTEIECELVSIWTEVLKVEKIGIHDNFFRIGGDSIISIQMVSKARSKGIYFAVKDVFNYPTVSGLASVSKTQESSPTFKPDQSVIEGDVPLTPIQHWFFDSDHPVLNHFNQAMILQASKKLDSSLLTQLFSILLSHHDALRLRYHQDAEGKWSQTSLENLESFSVQEIDLSYALQENQLSLAIEEHASLAQQSLDITKGPLLKAVLFDCGSSRPQRLLIVIHHLAVDGVSWRILLEDLETGYIQLSQGETPSLPPKTHSYQQWANALKVYASSQSLLEEIPYWKQIQESVRPLPVDFDHGPPTGESARTIAVSLTEDETTQLLQRVPKAYRTEINDILLTALILAIGDWTKTYALTLSLEGHGREEIIDDIDLSRTVGWFTSFFPVHLNIDNPNDLGEAIKTVKETLRQIPHKGIGYGVLSYLSNDKESFLSDSQSPTASSSTSHFPHPTLRFNYLGQWDNTSSQDDLFTFAQESVGQNVSDKNSFSYLININSEIKEGALQLFLSYKANHYNALTIKSLSHTFIDRLKQIIEHCFQKENFGYTPSDFSLTNLEKSKLDKRITAIKDSW